jgi:isoamyl acetate esterase
VQEYRAGKGDVVQYVVKGALLLTIFFGANDCALPDGTSSRQHVPIPQYKDNLKAIIAHAKSAGIENILLITPPPVDEAARVKYNKGIHGVNAKETSERSNAVAGEYAAACKEVSPTSFST